MVWRSCWFVSSLDRCFAVVLLSFWLSLSLGGAMYFSWGLSTYLGRSSAIEASISFIAKQPVRRAAPQADSARSTGQI